MSSVTTEFMKQSVVTLLQKFVERRKIWMTVATSFAAAEELKNMRRGDVSQTL